MNVKRVVEGYEQQVTIAGDRNALVVVEFDDGSFGVEQGVVYAEEFQFHRDPKSPFHDDFGPDTPRFTTPEAAKKFQELMASHGMVSQDLAAFHAPSECYKLAYAGWERDHRAELLDCSLSCFNPSSLAYYSPSQAEF